MPPCRLSVLLLVGMVVVVVLLLAKWHSTSSDESYMDRLQMKCDRTVRAQTSDNFLKCIQSAWDQNDLTAKKRCYDEKTRRTDCCAIGSDPNCTLTQPLPFFTATELQKYKAGFPILVFNYTYFHHKPSGLTIYPFNTSTFGKKVDAVVYYEDRGKAPEQIRLLFNTVAPFSKGVILQNAVELPYNSWPSGTPLMSFEFDGQTGDLLLEGVPDGLWSSFSSKVKKPSIRLTAVQKYPQINGVGWYVWTDPQGWGRNDDTTAKQYLIVPPGERLSHAILLPPHTKPWGNPYINSWNGGPEITVTNVGPEGYVGRWVKLDPSMFTQYPADRPNREPVMTLKLMNKEFGLVNPEF